MRKIAVALAIAVAVLATTSTASSAADRRCGNKAAGPWTSQPVTGVAIRGLIARGATCRLARWLAVTAFTKTPYGARRWSAHGWTCRFAERTSTGSRVACRKGRDGLVRWRNGAEAASARYLSVRYAQRLIWEFLKYRFEDGAYGIYSDQCRRFAANSVNCRVVFRDADDYVRCGRITVWLRGPYYGTSSRIGYC